jgi:hypothetical protein
MTARRRKLVAEASIDAIDPDIEYGENSAVGVAPYSNLAQLTDRDTDSVAVATFELGHWPLDGTAVVPDVAPMTDEVGYVSDVLGDANGVLSGTYAQVNISGVDVLTIATITFSPLPMDGYAVDFTVDFYSDTTIAASVTRTGNDKLAVQLDGFVAYNVTAIRVTPTLWSKPHTRARIVEILPGAYEVWEGDRLYSLETYDEIDPSMLTMPYGSATVIVDNSDRRYDPYNKNGIFRQIEGRQEIPIKWRVLLPDDTYERLPGGSYYQQNRGWETTQNGVLIKFSLVDIVGLLRDRKFRPPLTLPTTLGGWVSELVSQLGTNFNSRYYVDASLGDFPLTTTQDAVKSITCGELLRNACMAAGAVAYADKATGNLFAVPMPSATGAQLDLDNLASLPVVKANTDIAAIAFQLADGDNTQVIVNGTSSAADTTVSVSNLFIHDSTAAQIVARRIIGNYGGQRFETTGRGNPLSELLDLDDIEYYRGEFAGARRVKQKLVLSNKGIVRDATASHVQATGEDNYSNTVAITASGTWTAPDGVLRLRVTLISGGQGGAGGHTGGNNPFASMSPFGAAGVGGISGLVWTQTIDINAEQVFSVAIGEGGNGGSPSGYGAPDVLGALGAPTTFGAYTSANGIHQDGLVDLTTGAVYAKNGVAGKTPSTDPGIAAQGNTGNGGGGGSGGFGYIHTDHITTDVPAKPGTVGGKGGSGIVLISYDLPEV